MSKFLASSLIALSSLSAQSQCDLPTDMMCGYNAPASILTECPWNVWVDASFIYWVPYEENLEPAILSNGIVTNMSLGAVGGLLSVNDSRRVVNMDFDYKPGFQVAMSFGFKKYDRWNLEAEYTRYHGSHSKGGSVDGTVSSQAIVSNGITTTNTVFGDFFLPLQLGEGTAANYFRTTFRLLSPNGLMTAGTVYTSTYQESWKLDTDFFDLDLGRWFFVGTRLLFRPFFGLRAAWIDQSLSTTYTAVNDSVGKTVATATGHATIDSKAIGARGGLFTQWNVGKGFYLKGDLEADVLYTRYTYHRTDQFLAMPANSLVSVTYPVREKSDPLKPHMDLELGCGWDSFFYRNKFHFALSADYGFQVFFDQNMFRFFVDAYPENITQGFTVIDPNFGLFMEMPQSLAPHGNLYVHGLTVTAKLDF